MRVYVSENHRVRGKVGFEAVLEALAAAGLSGASVFRGIEGYGASRRLSVAASPDTIPDLPMLIEIVDDGEKLRAFLPQLDDLLEGGFVTFERVEIVLYRPMSDTPKDGD